MNQPIFLTKFAFNSLLTSLLDVEEGINELIDEFFPKPSEEAKIVKQLLDEYVKQLDCLIRSITVDETAANDFPCAVIGSEVTIEDVEGRIYRYCIVSPYKKRIDSNEVSFLSPIGKALLLKEVNDRFVVKAPGGDYEYKVLSVKIAPEFKSPKSIFTWMKGGR
jgi:transcription elongation factor GreA